MRRPALLFIFGALLLGHPALAEPKKASGSQHDAAAPQPINLVTVLRLAGANNLDVQIARQRVAEADANALSAAEQFFPSLYPGLGYRRHEDNLQAVEGTIINADKEQYTAGTAAIAQVDLGDAIFRTLAARQLLQAARHAATAQVQESVFEAAQGYFELARAQAAIGVASQSVEIERDYYDQLMHAVEAGLAFKGDAFRAATQVERTRLTLEQALAQQRFAAAGLSQILHLDPSIALTPLGSEFVPIRLISAGRSLDSLVADAYASRPELRQFAAQLEAAKKSHQGAVYGPLIPTINGQAYYGGLGGGVGNPGPDHFSQSSDYAGGLAWRIGPGGLFDVGRIRASDARARASALELAKTRDEVARQVVDGYTRIHSLSNQLETARRQLSAAEQALQLTRERREFGVGIVLETIQAEQDLTRARLDYVTTVAEHNKAQYALRRAVGTPPEAEAGASRAASKERAGHDSPHK